MRRALLVAAAVALFVRAVAADDWPTLGRDKTRNSVSPERNPPLDWAIKGLASKFDKDGNVLERHAADRNIKWKVTLGYQSHGLIAVSGGLVWIGTNNDIPRDPAIKGDAGVLMCFRESDGKFLYQHVSPRLKAQRHNDWMNGPISNTPLIEGDRLWFTTTRCETVCLDISLLLKGIGTPTEVWKVDMIGELGVHPHSAGMDLSRTCSVAGYRDYVYVITGNGVDETHTHLPAPLAPSLVCLDKHTGRIVWKDNSPGGEILHSQTASPLVAEIGGRAQCIAPQGDGWLRSFDARTGKLLWKFDTNAKSARFRPGGGSRNELVAAPVLYEGRIYIANGQEAEHGEGSGALYCIDPTKDGDISAELDDGPLPPAAKEDADEKKARANYPGQPRKGKPNPNSGVIWSFGRRGNRVEDQMHRTVATVAVHKGLVIAPDLAGFIHCLDAKTGARHWVYDAMASVWAPPLIADGKIYIGNDDSELLVFELSKEMRLIAKRNFNRSLYCSPVFANGVLYVVAGETLYAIAGPGAEKLPAEAAEPTTPPGTMPVAPPK